MTKLGSKFAFYGTLRSNQGNWNYFLRDRSNSLGTKTLRGYRMHSFGGYPFVVKTGNENDVTVVELFDVLDDSSAHGIHRMEVGAGYGTEIINIDGEEYLMYVYAPFHNMENYPVVEDGDWVEYRSNQMKRR